MSVCGSEVVDPRGSETELPEDGRRMATGDSRPSIGDWQLAMRGEWHSSNYPMAVRRSELHRCSAGYCLRLRFTIWTDLLYLIDLPVRKRVLSP